MTYHASEAPPPGTTVYEAYTDGSVGPRNPGAGGWAWLLLDPGTGKEVARQCGGAAYPQTNNTMELQACISLLQWCPPGTHVTIHSDSEYVVKGYNEYAMQWVLRQWKTASGKDVKNVGLWRQLLHEAAVRYPVFVHVRGHQGQQHNELCDDLAGTVCKLYYGTVPQVAVLA